MTDFEIISTFMEPAPEAPDGTGESKGGWWIRDILEGANPSEWRFGPWRSAIEVWSEPMQLGKMHEVEAKLTDEQCALYELALGELIQRASIKLRQWHGLMRRYLWHADAPTRIVALASVVRAEVEKRRFKSNVTAVREESAPSKPERER